MSTILAASLAVSVAWAESPPCAAPAATADGWRIAEPGASGFDAAAFCAGIAETLKVANVHAVIVERGGRLVAETYRSGRDRKVWSFFATETNFDALTLHDVRSVTKSVVGLLFGIARGQGKMGSLSTPVVDFYPQYPELRTPERERIALQHLLTMSTGLAWNESVASYGTFANDETRLFWDWAPYRFVLSRPVEAPPGAKFNYNGGNTAILADIIERATGSRLDVFADSALFKPLGISEWEWASDLHGRKIAFAGLRLRPRDLAKIGRMMLDNGRWHGRQVVPEDWVRESFSPHVETGGGWAYGYQWWTSTANWNGHKVRWNAAIGNGGQRLFVVPELDLVLVITAGRYNDPEAGRVLLPIFRQALSSVRP